MTPTDPFGVYIHWPYCVAKCPYCDFNSRAAKDVDARAWAQSYGAELDRFADLTPGRTVTSIFFGGGTPSLMPPDLVAALLDAVHACWTVADDAEITLEANPGTSERGLFKGFAQAGVNRISLGIQSLDDDVLKFLGRIHDADEARQAIALAQDAVDRVNLDFIYALPGQTVADWDAMLTQALAFGTEHLSLYQLTIEDGTPFQGQYDRGAFALPDEALASALWDLTRAKTAAAGLPAYEVSNHARPGAESRHNLLYWQGYDYVGVGPGAHGRITVDGATTAISQIKSPDKWLSADHRDAEAFALTPDERVDELILMGLRLTDGIDAARFKSQTGKDIVDVVDAAALNGLRTEGLVVLDDKCLRLTAAGQPLLNAVLGALLT